ncbi:hypothetical protein FDI46_gp018 [Aeromonas phage AS-gz]|uniref:Uncharacterized protein n=1 Tax=Aeromonas phage AS-gz TaxID=2026082 RepID=A0A223LER4_9CAUD|nr:hypothetical protein FDI46_gp018 [Aeromonas phage AS-gz]ASU00554.1 hypothetical protein [Aeromonas phage AS-gz]
MPNSCKWRVRSLKYKIAITGSFGGAAPANSLELTVNAGVNIDTLTVVRISGAGFADNKLQLIHKC